MSIIRRAAGIILIILGIVNILNFYAPRPIPTVGPQAFIIGGLFIVVGLLVRGVLRLPEGLSPGKDRPPRTGEALKRPGDPMLPVRALRLASERGGVLTVAQTAMDLNVSLDEAEASLDECVRRGSALMNLAREDGIPRYEFPEFLVPKEGEKS